MLGAWMMRAYAVAVAAITVAALVYVFVVPDPSLARTRDGVPFFTPPVAHPETGAPLDLGALIRHYRGD